MRLLVHVEGQTEEAFVNRVLAPNLYNFGYTIVSARLMGNARQRLNRGGVRPWTIVKQEIIRHLRGDNQAFSTLMVDFYAMPSGINGWPMRAEASLLQHQQKASTIEAALLDDIVREIGPGFDARRFIPYVTMHEFEAFLFSDCNILSETMANTRVAHQLEAICNAYENPEYINDSPHTAPSKRILNICPQYQKVFHGVNAAERIGITRIREKCPGFNDWITRLERHN